MNPVVIEIPPEVKWFLPTLGVPLAKLAAVSKAFEDRQTAGPTYVWTKTNIAAVKTVFSFASDAATKEFLAARFLTREELLELEGIPARADYLLRPWAMLLDIGLEGDIHAGILSKLSKRKLSASEIVGLDPSLLKALAASRLLQYASVKDMAPLFEAGFSAQDLAAAQDNVAAASTFTDLSQDPADSQRTLVAAWPADLSPGTGSSLDPPWASLCARVSRGALLDGNIIVRLNRNGAQIECEGAYQVHGGAVWAFPPGPAPFSRLPETEVWALTTAGLTSFAQKLAGQRVLSTVKAVTAPTQTISFKDFVPVITEGSSHAHSPPPPPVKRAFEETLFDNEFRSHLSSFASPDPTRLVDIVATADLSRVMTDRHSKISGLIAMTNGDEKSMVDILLSRSHDISGSSVVGNVNALLDDHHQDLPALRPAALPLTLNFRFARSYSADPAKSGGVSLQHFLSSGVNFSSVDQVVAVMGVALIVFQRLFCRASAADEIPFLSPVFQPLSHRLLIGGDTGLRDFPLPFVVFLVDEIFFRAGNMVNSHDAVVERWDRRKLLENLISLVASVIPADPTSRYVRWMATQGAASPAAVLAPKPARERAPRVRKPAAVRPAPRPLPAPNSPARTPAAVVRTDKQGVCHNHLLAHFGLGGPCTRHACVFSHVVADYSKVELLASVARLTRGDSSALMSKIQNCERSVKRASASSDLLLSSMQSSASAPVAGITTSAVETAVLGAHALIEALPGWLPRSGSRISAADIQNLIGQLSKEALWSAAELAADGFVFPASSLSRDWDSLIRLGSLSEVVREIQTAESPHRYNEERCRALFQDDPEYEKLLALAITGAVVPVGPDFISSNSPESFRALHHRIPHTFSKHAYELWEKKQALLLPNHIALTLGLHFSPIHWTDKPGKPLGRFLADLTNTSSGCAVNNIAAKAEIDNMYGLVNLPTIHDVVEALFVAADKAGGLENVLAWKEDVVGAFNQWNFSATSAKFLAFRISEDLTLISFTGIFGWQGSPAVYAIFGRAIDRSLTMIVNGVVVSYVDDYNGFGSRVSAGLDQLKTRAFLCAVFGPGAVNIAKSVLPCRVADSIGWILELDEGLIFPNDKGCRKIAAAFFSVDVTQLVSTKTYQKLGSLATRYSAVLVGTRPFVHVFYEHASLDRPRHPSSLARISILIWRAVALILLDDPKQLAVPLSSVSKRPLAAQFFVTSDAGPSGLGVVVRDQAKHIIAYASYRLPFTALESKYQNVREFLGLVLGLLLVLQNSKGHVRVSWTNDNKSALAWAQNDMAKSRAAQAAFLALSWLKIKGNIDLVEIEWIPGLSMGDVDALSRFNPVQHLNPVHDVSSRLPMATLDRLFSLADPTVDHPDNLHAWEVLFQTTLSVLDECIAPWSP